MKQDPIRGETYYGETLWRIFAWGVLILVLLWASAKAQAQEQYVRACQSSYACQLDSGVSWAAGIRTYVFTPIQPNVSLRIWVHNNNPTSAHTAQVITLFITDSTITNASLINQSDIWVQASITENSTVGAQCKNVNANAATTVGASGKGTCYASGMYAAQIAIQFNPGGAQAGNPDTFDIGIVQQPSVTPSGPQPGGGSNSGDYQNTVTSVPMSGALAANFCIPVKGGTQSIAGTATFNGFTSTSSVRLIGADGTTVSTGNAWDPVANRYVADVTVLPSNIFSIPLAGQESQACIRVTGGGGGTAVFTLTANAVNPYRFVTQSSATGALGATLDTVVPNVQVTTPLIGWSATDQGTAKQCSASVAASATGKRHVMTGCTVCVGATANQVPIFANLRDGATGAGTVKWAVNLAGLANTAYCEYFNGPPIIGTANTAATCELAAASAATNLCTATIQGYDQ